MQQGRVRQHGRFWVEHGGQRFVVDRERADAGGGGGFGLGDDGGDPLAHEANDVVEDVGVVGIGEMVLMQCGAVETAGHVLPGIDVHHARYGQGPRLVDEDDARVSVR